MHWHELKTTEHINLQLTLFSGQIFTFTRTSFNEFSGYLDSHLFIFKQSEHKIYYQTLHPSHISYLTNFFTLEINYSNLFEKWQFLTLKYTGLRLLQIDFIETIFSFICSQNNNIKRITTMVKYLKDQSDNFNLNKICFEEDNLKKNKFGYRSRYIIDAVEKIKNMDKNIKMDNEANVRKFLMSIKGVGRKVCDCILLMGCGFYSVIPLDVHIMRMTREVFGCENNKKMDSDSVNRMYREMFGEYCGIAQLYLFKYSLDNGAKNVKNKKLVLKNKLLVNEIAKTEI